jgi:hypothetical protein
VGYHYGATFGMYNTANGSSIGNSAYALGYGNIVGSGGAAINYGRSMGV